MNSEYSNYSMVHDEEVGDCPHCFIPDVTGS